MGFSPFILSRLLLMLFLVCGVLSLPVQAQTAPARPAIYDFGMGKCLSCKLMEKVLEEVREKYGEQVEIRLLYADQEQDLFRRFKIIAVPTQVFLDPSGKEVDRHLGLFPRDDLVKKLKALKFIKE